MRKVIGFAADKFVPSAQVPNNKVKKTAFTEMAAHSCLAYKMGDWNWNWSQIEQVTELEPNTDYMLRFAVYGGYNDTEDSTLFCSVCTDGNWENRKNYELSQYSVEPSICKKCGDNILRVYEIPFTTGDTGYAAVVFAAMHAVAYIMPAFTDESYKALKDTNYDEWWASRQEYLALEAKNKAKANKRKAVRTIAVIAAVVTVAAILLHKNDKNCEKSKCCLGKCKSKADEFKVNALKFREDASEKLGAAKTTAKAFLDEKKDAVIIKIDNVKDLLKK